MPEKRKKSAGNATRSRRNTTGKVGSDPKAARKVGGKLDFGVPETGSERDRQYVSQETRLNDPGSAPEHSHNTGDRVTGAGGNASGVGSSSGGDVDTDLVGVGTGGVGLAQDGPDRTEGADIIEGDQPVSEAFASKQLPRGKNIKVDPNRKAPSKRNKPMKGTTIDRSGGDVSTTGEGQGPAAVTNPLARDDDSFAGEINIDEASGIDNSPSDRK